WEGERPREGWAARTWSYPVRAARSVARSVPCRSLHRRPRRGALTGGDHHEPRASRVGGVPPTERVSSAGDSGCRAALCPGPSAEKLTLTFASVAEGERWCREVQARQQQFPHDAAQGDRHQPEGVALVRQAPEVPHVVLGRVECTEQSQWAADRGLQLRAGI